MTRTQPGTAFGLLLAVGLILGVHAHPALAKDPCNASCGVERKGCQSSFRAAFQADKLNCAGTKKVRRQCVNAARRAFHAALKACRSLASDCRTCCKADGATCDVQCGDGIVSAGEDCDPPGRNACAGSETCTESCKCPVATTTSTAVMSTSTAVTTTSIAVTTSTAVTTTSAAVTTTAVPSTTTTLPTLNLSYDPSNAGGCVEGNSGNTPCVFRATLTAPSTETVNFSYQVSNATNTCDATECTAIPGNDYVATSDTGSIPAGQTFATFSISVVGDTTYEANETFAVHLAVTDPSPAAAAGPDMTATIANDDAQPNLSIGDVSHNEGDLGATYYVFNVTLDAPAGIPVSVDYTTNDGTGTAPGDYTHTSGTVTFKEGETNEQVTVLVNGDLLSETDETFSLNLGNATNASITTGTGTGTILDDDVLPALTIADTSVVEGQGGTTTMTFTVSLSAPSGQDISVDYATADGTATVADGDYAATSGTLAFLVGAATTHTFSVSIAGDTGTEGNEAILANLSNADPFKVRVVRSQAQGVIYDDDGPADPCTPIVTLPFVIPSSGKYCVASDLLGTVTSGAGVTINASNVDLDLKGFTIGGGGDPASQADGVYALDRQSVSVHGGMITGFLNGVRLTRSPLSLAAQNNSAKNLNLPGNTRSAVWLDGTGNVIVGCVVGTTGGTTLFGADADTYGIVSIGTDAQVAGNTVQDTVGVGGGSGIAIDVGGGDRDAISGLVLSNTAPTACGVPGGNCSIGIRAATSTGMLISGNQLQLFDYGIVFDASSTATLELNSFTQVTTDFTRQ